MKDLKPQTNLSPSSINTYFHCPRQYFFRYIAKLKIKPSIHLLKGTIVHGVLEDFFKSFEDDFKTRAQTLLKSKLKSYDKPLKQLKLTDEELNTHIKDATNMINDFIDDFSKKVNNIIDIGHASSKEHAFNLLKPKFKEMYVKNEQLHCVGYIDRVDMDFSGNIILGDYKTSKKYGISLTDDYKRQMAIYALLYKEQTGTYPTHLSIIFLRYNEQYIMEVTPSIMKGALVDVIDTYEKTRSLDIEDYPLKESKLCGWCNFLDECRGMRKLNKQDRLEKLKELIKKKEEDDEQNDE